MAPILTWIVVALVTALVVMAVAGTTSGAQRRGVRSFVADVRDGLRRREPGPSVGILASARRELAEAAEAEGTLDDIFRVGQTPRAAYVEVGELARPLAGATRRLLGTR